MDSAGYFGAMGTLDYWSLKNFALFGHLADIAAVILLVTSNNLSKKTLGTAWKKVQKLSYVFFYASSLYVYLSFGHMRILLSMSIVTTVTILAYLRNRARARNALATTPTNPKTI
jgi:DMSO/TMAO reductase YedYZ heme-binding membrane subunit